ncbi:hypothetical protein ANTQUA_LOCUS2649 [Anthophora quadrimaculata]
MVFLRWRLLGLNFSHFPDKEEHQGYQRERFRAAMEDHQGGGGSDSRELDRQSVTRIKVLREQPCVDDGKRRLGWQGRRG